MEFYSKAYPSCGSLAGRRSQAFEPLIVSMGVGLNPYAAQLRDSDIFPVDPVQPRDIRTYTQILLRYPTNKRIFDGKLKATYKTNNHSLTSSYHRYI